MNELFEVRDMRSKEKFFIDDAYLNGYAKLCGINATMVYLCLCRHADRKQESFPSVELMAEKTGLSRDSIMRGIKSLIEWNIIHKERERKENARWLNNRYILLDKSAWKNKPSSSEQLGEPSCKLDPSQVANEGVSQVAVSDTKDTHKKDTHIRIGNSKELQATEIRELVDNFKSINPFYLEFYKNTTERKALQDMVDKLTYPKVLGLIKNLKEINSRPFYPKSTKPTELKRNLSKLIALFTSNSSENKLSNKYQVEKV